MNCSAYVFGELFSGYNQYPEDNSSLVYQEIAANCKASTQVVIHRDDDLMQYCYIRKIANNKYIGLSVLVTGYYISALKKLFSLFETTVDKMLKEGVAIKYSESGDVVITGKKLSSQKEDLDGILNELLNSFVDLGNEHALPTSDYSVSKNSTKEFDVTADKQKMINASYTYGFTYIYKSEDFDTIRIDSYRSTLNRVNNENQKLKKENERLYALNKKINRQKKQFKNVVFLILVVFVCGVGLFFLHDTLTNTRGELSSARNTIEERNATISKNKSTIKQNESKISELNTSLQNEKAENDKLNKKISDLTSQYPIAISEIEVNSEEFSFDYDSQEEKELTFTLKAINERNGYIISNSHTLTYYADGGHKSLRFSSKLNTSDYYYVILMYDGKIIAGKRW